MNGVTVRKIEPNEFKPISEMVHRSCFNEERPADFNRYDYVLVCLSDKEDKFFGYSTILEHDAETAEMQHGGSVSGSKFLTVKSFLMVVEWLKAKYPVITIKIFNHNISMLNMAMRAGLRIHGVEYYQDTQNFKGGVLLCLKMEREPIHA